MVISIENWRDIIAVQFNPKMLYFLSLLVKRNINENNTRSNSQIHKIIVIMLSVLIVKVMLYDEKVCNRKKESRPIKEGNSV